MRKLLASKTLAGVAPWKFLLLSATLLFTYAIPAHADNHEEAAPAAEEAEAGPVDDYQGLLDHQGEYAPAFDFFTTSMLWTCIAAALVFLMHLGFATLESGLCQQKNVVNVLFKNVFIISIGVITYAFCGFNTHYPGDFNGWFSWGSMIGDLNADGMDTWGYGGLSLAMTGFGDFIFQAMFAATGATIVSGAVAERVKLSSFMIFALVFVGFAYPVAGSWHWGGGVLASMDFKDFAGSTVVHAFGGLSLGLFMVLTEKRKYTENGIKPIPAHSFPLAIGFSCSSSVGTALMAVPFYRLIPLIWDSFSLPQLLVATAGAIKRLHPRSIENPTFPWP